VRDAERVADAIWARVARLGAAIEDVERDPSARSHVQEPLVFDVFEADGREGHGWRAVFDTVQDRRGLIRS
jgi:hypothetical protein